MTDNLISFENERLDRAIDSVFGETEEERTLAAINSRIEFIETELRTVQEYIGLSYAGSITVAMDDGSEAPINPFPHLGSVLENYERLLTTEIARMEAERQDMLAGESDV